MAAHYEIASEFFQQVIQKRRHEGDLAAPKLDPALAHLARVERPVRRLWDEGEIEPQLDLGDESRSHER